jgi:hypothetical protein
MPRKNKQKTNLLKSNKAHERLIKKHIKSNDPDSIQKILYHQFIINKQKESNRVFTKSERSNFFKGLSPKKRKTKSHIKGYATGSKEYFEDYGDSKMLNNHDW